MRAILFLIGGIVLANIVTATFLWRPSAQATAKPEPVVNSATLKGQEPWMASEYYQATNRDNARKSALDALGKPWSSFCEAAGKKRLVESIDYYPLDAHRPSGELSQELGRAGPPLHRQGLDHAG